VVVTANGKLLRPKRLPSGLFPSARHGFDRVVLDCITSLKNGADLLWIETEKPHVGQIAEMVNASASGAGRQAGVQQQPVVQLDAELPSAGVRCLDRRRKARTCPAYDPRRADERGLRRHRTGRRSRRWCRTSSATHLAKAGIFHHLITLPTYHTAALSTDNLAKGYFGELGMLAYVDGVQRQEIRQGVPTVKHQDMAGSNIGDDHKEYFSGEAALKAGGKRPNTCCSSADGLGNAGFPGCPHQTLALAHRMRRLPGKAASFSRDAPLQFSIREHRIRQTAALGLRSGQRLTQQQQLRRPPSHHDGRQQHAGPGLRTQAQVDERASAAWRIPQVDEIAVQKQRGANAHGQPLHHRHHRLFARAERKDEAHPGADIRLRAFRPLPEIVQIRTGRKHATTAPQQDHAHIIAARRLTQSGGQRLVHICGQRILLPGPQQRQRHHAAGNVHPDMFGHGLVRLWLL
jgi:hypothetical protein